MKIPSEAKILRIHIGESDKDISNTRPLYKEVTCKAHEAGLAGTTVIRGILGFGANSVIHSNKVLRLSEDLPIIIEIVDAPEKIEAFLPTLDDLITEGLITIEDVHVVTYRRNSNND